MRNFLVTLITLANILSRGLTTSKALTNAVKWDKYSLSVNGTRVFISSAEFHYQRLPVPELWLDVFQKLKANGFNTVSIYFFWSYHSPAKGVYDFETSGKNLQQLFDYAKEAGLWVIARAGPYCNAETNGGGLALWGSDGSLGKLRSNDETYHQAWLPWVQKVGKIIAANQIDKGGPVILNQVENEFTENTHSASAPEVQYMSQLETAFRASGVTVPLTHNEKGMRAQSWSSDYGNVGGAVDVYGLDSYPGSLSCSDPSAGFNVVRTYFQWFANYSFTQPSFLPEFEGGWFSAWGDKSFYDDCKSEHDPAFADVYYKNNIGQRVTMQNVYMAFGGTNWGHSAAPVVYTSYDYSAPLRETRQQTPKLLQTKLVNLFATSSPELLTTTMVGNGTGYRVSSASVFSWVLKNPTSGATFTVIQQAKTPSTSDVTVSATLSTSAGDVAVPDVALAGRQSKILVTDYAFGARRRLLYSSADVLTQAAFDGGVDALVLYLKAGQVGELALPSTSGAWNATGSSTVAVTAGAGGRQVVRWTQGAGATVVTLSGGSVVLYLLEQQTAWRFWSPAATVSAGDLPYGTAAQRVFVLGPYLVRSAALGADGILRLVGDNDVATTLEAYAGNVTLAGIEWNGRRLAATRTAYGAYTAALDGAEGRAAEAALPALTSWRSADSLPEIDPAYDDSRWAVCNKTTTLSPTAPITLPVLFSSDYGFFAGPKIYRGYFDGTDSTSVNLTASGGFAAGWSAWLNGAFLGSEPGRAGVDVTSGVLALPSASLRAQNNVLTVLVDYHGHDQTSAGKGLLNPRGLLGARLLPGSASGKTGGFKTWKIQGAAGGGNADAVRGPMNEGGLHGERLGWHLPGFAPAATTATSAWDASSPGTGLRGAGVRWYTTAFNLSLPADLDMPLGVQLSAPAGTVARATLWVNGYQYGRFVPHLGPQTRFPIPPGVLDPSGENTLAVALWAQTAAGARLDRVELVAYGRYESGFGFDRKEEWGKLRPGWSDRSRWA